MIQENEIKEIKKYDLEENIQNSSRNPENSLIIIPCSKNKSNVSEGKAIDIYDGPFYRILRKNKSCNSDVLIISAKYGLLESDDRISPYDLKMTTEIANSLKEEVQEDLKQILSKGNYDRILINLGKVYWGVLEDFDFEMFGTPKIDILEGPIWARNRSLKEWVLKLGVARK